MWKPSVSAVVAGFGFLFALEARAVPVTYELQATVTTGVWTTPGAGPITILPGTLGTLRFVADSDTPADSGSSTSYSLGPAGAPLGSLDAGTPSSNPFVLLGPASLFLNDLAGALSQDIVSFGSTVREPICDCPVTPTHLIDASARAPSLLSSEMIQALPLTPATGLIEIHDAGGPTLLSLSVTSIQAVPEPSLPWLALTAVLALSALVTRSYAACGASPRASARDPRSCCSSTSARSGR